MKLTEERDKIEDKYKIEKENRETLQAQIENSSKEKDNQAKDYYKAHCETVEALRTGLATYLQHKRKIILAKRKQYLQRIKELETKLREEERKTDLFFGQIKEFDLF